MVFCRPVLFQVRVWFFLHQWGEHNRPGLHLKGPQWVAQECRGGGVGRGVQRGQIPGFKAAEEKVKLTKKERERNGDSEKDRFQMSQVGKIPNFPKRPWKS